MALRPRGLPPPERLVVVLRRITGRTLRAMTRGDQIAGLSAGLVDTTGVTARELREAALRGVRVPDPWTAYVEKVRHASYGITDQDIEYVVAASGSEDAVFEMTLAAAVSAAADRLEAGLRALREAG